MRKYDSVTSFGNHVHLGIRERIVDLKRNAERKEGAAISCYQVYGSSDGVQVRRKVNVEEHFSVPKH